MQCTASKFSGQTELSNLAGLLSQSQRNISNDSGGIHISAASEKLKVCILGGGNFGRFVPYLECTGQTNKLEVVFRQMPCNGCNWDRIYSLKKN